MLALLAIALRVRSGGPPRSLTIFCAAGLREPLEAIRAAYEKENSVHLTVHYGGSSTLLSNLRLNHDADLFLPADDSYIEIAKADGLVSETFPIAQMRPILAISKNPTRSASTRSTTCLRKRCRIFHDRSRCAATGKLVQGALEKAGKWDAFKARVTVFKGTVSEVAADLQVGAGDAGIVWDAMLKQLPDCEEAPLPDLAGVTARVVAGIHHNNEAPPFRPCFRGVSRRADKGQQYFMDAGFEPAEVENTNRD